MKKLVFATNNEHKLEEVRALLKEIEDQLEEPYEILSLSDIGCNVDIPETGMTFADNALQKAEYVKIHYNVDCFADDSGLEVRALGMEPGVRSARYADDDGFSHNDEANMDKLLNRMSHVKERQAQFRTVVVLLMDGNKYEFEGVCRGEIGTQRVGNKGFGYDPLFYPEGHSVTFAEMALEDKNLISHRGRAIKQLVKFLATKEYE